jgi:hypothetical protein
LANRFHSSAARLAAIFVLAGATSACHWLAHYDCPSCACADGGESVSDGDSSHDGADVKSPGLEITSVSAASLVVRAGQIDLPITVKLRNTTQTSLDITRVTLRFADLATTSRDAEFSATCLELPLTLQSKQEAMVPCTVDVLQPANTGYALIDAHASWQMQGNRHETEGAQQTDGWQVIAGKRLLVTTLLDENQIGADPATELAAGNTLSLREAILIANALGASEQAAVIQFEPSVFKTGSVIELTEALPDLMRDGTVIDGEGADVTISGAGISPMEHISALYIAADHVTIRKIHMRDTGGAKGVHCLNLGFGNNLKLTASRFSGCGKSEDGHGAQVMIDRGSNHRIYECTFENGERDGLFLDKHTWDSRVHDNTMIRNGDDGLTISGRRTIVWNNVIADNGDHGVETAGHDHILKRNTFDKENMAIGVYETISTEIVENKFSNCYIAIRLEVNVKHVQAKRNLFTRCNQPIEIKSGLNEGVAPPTIDAHDSQQISGSAGVVEGTVELYAVDGDQLRPLVLLPVQGGKWSYRFKSTPPPKIAATVTTTNGSTSAFCAPSP